MIPIKTPNQVIRSMVEVVAKGGSLLLGVGPTPEGTFPDAVNQRLEDIGKWMKANGKAIYGTRITPDYHQGNTWFTQSKDKQTRNAIYCFTEDAKPSGTIEWTGNVPKKGAKMVLLNSNQSVKWEVTGTTVSVHLPETIKNNAAVYGALAFSYPVQ